MDNFDTESNCSFQSDSLHSNASSVSGLSLYGNEFAELRHVVNPSKYPQPYLERSGTPKAETSTANEAVNEVVNKLKIDLQKSLELNEQYTYKLQNLEKENKLKYGNKIDILLSTNKRLEQELNGANSQIERLIKNYVDRKNHLSLKEKLDLERKIYQLSSEQSFLKQQNDKCLQERNEVDLQNRSLKITIGELLTEKEIKQSSIQSLKQKVSDQHIEIQNLTKVNINCNDKISNLSKRLAESEKSRLWYKEQLNVCQEDKIKLKEELVKSKDTISNLNEKKLNLNIELSKYKSEIDEVRYKALKEKEELFRKLENINLDNILKLVPINNNIGNCELNHNEDHYVHHCYNETIHELNEDLNRLKANISEKELKFEKITKENSLAISKCLILQKTLEQKEINIQLLESAKMHLTKKLEFFKEGEKNVICENLQLKNRLSKFSSKIKFQNEEREEIEKTVQLIRQQFANVKENYERIKAELKTKNEDILKLEKDRQDLFMKNNWTISELGKMKDQDIIIADLKKHNDTLLANLETSTQKVRILEVQNLKLEGMLKEKEDVISNYSNEISNLEEINLQHKTSTSQNKEKISFLEQELKEISEVCSKLKEENGTIEKELQNRTSKIQKLLEALESQQSQHKSNIATLSLDKDHLSTSYKSLQEKYEIEIKHKNATILTLRNKLQRIENNWQNYLERITDDQKVQLLSNIQSSISKEYIINLPNKCPDPQLLSEHNIKQVILNAFNNLNLDEFESSISIKLKHLEKKIKDVKEKSVQLYEKLDNNNSKENKIKELEIQLQVKDRNMQEKQKRMDKNNRTLLHKVKEHMRGRNAAEKQLKYLQDLYNILADEHNTLKLSTMSNEREINLLNQLYKKYKDENQILKITVKKMEQEMSERNICEKCCHLQEKVIYFEELYNEVQKNNACLDNDLKLSRESMKLLQDEHNLWQTELNALQDQLNIYVEKDIAYKALISQLQETNNKIVQQEKLISTLTKKLEEKEFDSQKSLEIIDILNEDLRQASEKMRYYTNELEIKSSTFQQNVEYSEELENKITVLEEQILKSSTNYQNTINECIKNNIFLQNDIKVLKNDKFALQRLSNDLKFALNSCVAHNKKLQSQLVMTQTEKQPFSVLSTNLPDELVISGKYDEKYISQLLEENRTPSRPITKEIQCCLSKLKDEIFHLQDQISKKNNLANMEP